jgi:hypothetical protein
MQVNIEKGMIENENRVLNIPPKMKKITTNFHNVFFCFLHVSGPLEQTFFLETWCAG